MFWNPPSAGSAACAALSISAVGLVRLPRAAAASEALTHRNGISPNDHGNEARLLQTTSGDIACEFVLDGTSCNSCRFCGSEETGFGRVEVDCSNVQEGATTSCDSLEEVAFGVNPSTGYSTKVVITSSPTIPENPYSEGIGPDDKLIVSQAHDQCINFDGRTPQLTGREIKTCKLISSSSDGFVAIHCRQNPSERKKIEAMFESACAKEGGQTRKTSFVNVQCKGEGLLDFYDYLFPEDNGNPRTELGLTHFHEGMHECFATSDCESEFDCETNRGYEAWYAAYLEEHYKLAGLDSVTCAHSRETGCYDALALALDNGDIGFCGHFRTVLVLAATTSFLFAL